jgi:hypothetical protein
MVEKHHPDDQRMQFETAVAPLILILDVDTLGLEARQHALVSDHSKPAQGAAPAAKPMSFDDRRRHK